MCPKFIRVTLDTHHKSDAEKVVEVAVTGVQQTAPAPTRIQTNRDAAASSHQNTASLAQQDGNMQVKKEEAQGLTVSEAQIIEAIEHANKAFRIVSTRFEFSIHEGTKEIMVKVIDEQTNEVIREIPPEKILDIVAKLWELVGIIVDEKA